MTSFQINVNGPRTQVSAELNHHAQDVRDAQKTIRDRVVAEGHGLSEEDESRINEDVEDLNDGRKKSVQGILHRPQQQPQGPVVCWERFLPLRSLKVLLVENDDSTRHVVSALLRNCSYEVTAVANGVQAWSILDDLTNHVDIVLAEVVLPCLSGIGLLCKIMNHKTCKNIPVIMMSSHDSMGIVFKCLSKGAVDFFVKPIRKNELKNLWQHVWRKFHRSSDSGSESESGIQSQKSARPKCVDGSDNNTGSNNEDDNGSIGFNVRDGSDKGSGTQSSWTKRAVEVDRPRPTQPWDQSTDPPDNTCAQVTHSWPEAFENLEHDDELDNVEMGKDLKIGVPRNSNLQLQDPEEKRKKVLPDVAGADKDKFQELELKKDVEKSENRQMDLNSNKPNDESDKEVVDLMSVIAKNTDPHKKSMTFKIPNGLTEVPETEDKACNTKEIPSLELSLKRLRDTGDTDTNPRDQIILRHSELSAFSRYTCASTAIRASTGNVGICPPLDNSSEAAKTESMHNFQSYSNGTLPNQSSNGSSNNDMGSTTNNVYTESAAFNDQSTSKSVAKCLQHSSFQPVQNTILAHPRAMPLHVQMQSHHYHYHHHVHNISPKQQTPTHDDLSLKSMAKSAQQCGSSNVLNVPVEGHAYNHSFNGSASGSNHGSNGQNGCITAANAQGTNLESDDGIAGAGGGSGSGSGSRNGVDQNQSAQREAALNKFRQKRKERCFEKKVRYQSRKRLAEQRPRVRGQFVRRVVHENKSKDADG